MQIAYNNLNMNFTARNKYIKKADDICRAATSEFPMMSPSKVYMKYLSYRFKSPNCEKVRDLNYNLERKLDYTRHNGDEKCEKYGFEDKTGSLTGIPLLCKLDSVRESKVGNCSESAAAALAALYANGYYNANIAYPELQVDVIDKKTGKIVSKGETGDIDHVFVLADMKNNGVRNVIIDPWLGFADHKSKASERYMSLMSEFDMEIPEILTKRRFAGGDIKDFDENKYALKKSIKIKEYPMEEIEEKKNSKDWVLGMFPNLYLKDRLNNMFRGAQKWM